MSGAIGQDPSSCHCATCHYTTTGEVVAELVLAETISLVFEYQESIVRSTCGFAWQQNVRCSDVPYLAQFRLESCKAVVYATCGLDQTIPLHFQSSVQGAIHCA